MGVNTVRFKFFKKDELKYLSHLDVLALMERALMRTGMPLLYSGGFHPKPKLSFSNPIPLGVQSIAEYCDIELSEAISAEDFKVHLNSKLPDNLKVIDVLSFEKTPENKILPLMSAIDAVIYEYELLSAGISSGEEGSKEIFKKSTLDGEIPKVGRLINESFFPDNFLKSFIEDFGKLFGPTGKDEECEADLQKIRNSIYNYEITTAQTAVAVASVQKNAKATLEDEADGADKNTADPEIIVADQTAAESEGVGSKITVATQAAAATAAIQTAAFVENTSDAASPGPQENIFFLKICGYAKILKNSSNTIFKFNAFNEYFEKFLETEDIEIRQVQKTGTYILKNNVLTDPIGTISF